MTPKEKAHELLDNFWLMDNVTPMLTKEQSKQCALICIEELLKTSLWGGEIDKQIDEDLNEYFLKVIEEINKL